MGPKLAALTFQEAHQQAKGKGQGKSKGYKATEQNVVDPPPGLEDDHISDREMLQAMFKKMIDFQEELNALKQAQTDALDQLHDEALRCQDTLKFIRKKMVRQEGTSRGSSADHEWVGDNS